jgi:hypothetical protein
LAQLIEPQPARVEEHKNVAGDRARLNLQDAIVGAQAIAELESQVWLPLESGNAQARASAHRGQDDDHAHWIPSGTHR